VTTVSFVKKHSAAVKEDWAGRLREDAFWRVCLWDALTTSQATVPRMMTSWIEKVMADTMMEAVAHGAVCRPPRFSSRPRAQSRQQDPPAYLTRLHMDSLGYLTAAD